MTLFDRAKTMLGRAAPIAAGGDILYSRATSAVWIDGAIFGRTEFQVEDSGGVRLEYSDRDFIFAADKLALNGALATPERGDRIEVTHDDGQANEVYEVLAPGGAQVYRRCDPQGTLFRVHCKRIG